MVIPKFTNIFWIKPNFKKLQKIFFFYCYDILGVICNFTKLAQIVLEMYRKN